MSNNESCNCNGNNSNNCNSNKFTSHYWDEFSDMPEFPDLGPDYQWPELDDGNFIGIKSLTYDDVILLPQPPDPDLPHLTSRSQIDLTVSLAGWEFDIPIMNSPMDCLVSGKSLHNMAMSGGIGVTSRFSNASCMQDMLTELASYWTGDPPLVLSVGTNFKDARDMVELCFDCGIEQPMILVDTANGYSINLEKIYYDLRRAYPDLFLIGGNICTYDGFDYLASCGYDAIRVGIGNGSMCTTRLMTGHGQGQVSALREVIRCRNAHYPDVAVIADGGIRNPGDVAKAIGLGADIVMMGRPFAGCNDNAPWAKDGDKVQYRGQASKVFMSDNGIENKLPEGEATYVDALSYASDTVLDQYAAGLRSALSYANAFNIEQFQARTKLRVVSNASLLESHTTHG